MIGIWSAHESDATGSGQRAHGSVLDKQFPLLTVVVLTNLDDFAGKFHQTCKEEIISTVYSEEERALLNSFYEARITDYPNIKTKDNF